MLQLSIILRLMLIITSDAGFHTKHQTKLQHHAKVTLNKLVRLIALQYAARKCKQNKRYHTSARLTLAYHRKRKFNYFGCALVRRF